MRTEIPRKSPHTPHFKNRVAWYKKTGRNFPNASSSPQITPSSKPRRLCFTGCSVWSVHGAQRKVTVGYPQVSVKRCQRLSRSSHISRYPPFCPNVFFVVVVARFEIQHDAVVNHVCMSKQLCQAESECPLLVRLRPVSLGAAWVKMLRCHNFKEGCQRRKRNEISQSILNWVLTIP